MYNESVHRRVQSKHKEKLAHSQVLPALKFNTLLQIMMTDNTQAMDVWFIHVGWYEIEQGIRTGELISCY